jgi:hypothetical protein
MNSLTECAGEEFGTTITRVETNQRDGGEVGDRIVSERGIEIAIGGMRKRGNINGVTICPGARDEFGRDVAAGAGLVLDQDLLAPSLG